MGFSPYLFIIIGVVSSLSLHGFYALQGMECFQSIDSYLSLCCSRPLFQIFIMGFFSLPFHYYRGSFLFIYLVVLSMLILFSWWGYFQGFWLCYYLFIGFPIVSCFNLFLFFFCNLATLSINTNIKSTTTLEYALLPK
jgi:hypothetical protein